MGRGKGRSHTHALPAVSLQDESEREISEHLKATGEQKPEVEKWTMRQL